MLSSLVANLSNLLSPVGGAVAAIIGLTLLVRLVVHPLTRAAVRGERACARIAPRVAQLRRRYAKDIPRLGTVLTNLYRGEGISPFAGVLPVLAQAPLFFLLYRTFTVSSAPVAAASL